MKKLYLIFPVLLFSLLISAQNSFNALMPKEIREAYREGTRSLSGKPGPNYWQNYSRYEIEATLDTEKSELTGYEKITYYNNSPDSLVTIVLRLYQDLFKKGNSRDWPVNPEDLHDGTQINLLKINNQLIDLNNPSAANRTSTNLIVSLPEPLHSGDSVEISCSWSFPVSKNRPVRMGNYGDNNFFIAYWYPQVAVYDDIDGWDMIEYSGTVEFYNDINEYDVSISTSGNQLVWATGELQNAEELFSKYTLKKLENAKNSDQVLSIATSEENRKNKVLINNKQNTWHFVAHQVPDFSFATANESNWEGSSLVVDQNTGRKVFIEAVYPDSVLTFNNVANYARNSITYMSEQLPGWPFPYPKITVFCNAKRSGGMESPMMCNNGDASKSYDADNLTFHEIVHNYFPFFMGTNERKYAWMDEGWAAYLVSGYNDIYSPDFDYFARYVNSFENFSGKEAEVPPIYLSYQIKDYKAYRAHAYARSALAYNYLRNALGDSLFAVALHQYMANWNGKHPVPYDFFNTIQHASNQQLDWFFLPWFFDRAYADLGIKKVTVDNKIVIENIGGLPLPVQIKCEFEDGTFESYSQNVSVWNSGNQAVIVEVNANKKIQNVQLGSPQIPDVNKHNNYLSP
ncbi:MAG TPA: M1 family metallopeptidase [Bacteroidales bacterium]